MQSGFLKFHETDKVFLMQMICLVHAHLHKNGNLASR